MSSIRLFSSILFIITMMIMININCYVLGQYNSDGQKSMINATDSITKSQFNQKRTTSFTSNENTTSIFPINNNNDDKNKNVTGSINFFKSLNPVIKLSENYRKKNCTNPAKNDDCQQILFDLTYLLRLSKYLKCQKIYKRQQFEKLIDQVNKEMTQHNCTMEKEALKNYHGICTELKYFWNLVKYKYYIEFLLDPFECPNNVVDDHNDNLSNFSHHHDHDPNHHYTEIPVTKSETAK